MVSLTPFVVADRREQRRKRDARPAVHPVLPHTGRKRAEHAALKGFHVIEQPRGPSYSSWRDLETNCVVAPRMEENGKAFDDVETLLEMDGGAKVACGLRAY